MGLRPGDNDLSRSPEPPTLQGCSAYVESAATATVMGAVQLPGQAVAPRSASSRDDDPPTARPRYCYGPLDSYFDYAYNDEERKVASALWNDLNDGIQSKTWDAHFANAVAGVAFSRFGGTRSLPSCLWDTMLTIQTVANPHWRNHQLVFPFNWAWQLTFAAISATLQCSSQTLDVLGNVLADEEGIIVQTNEKGTCPVFIKKPKDALVR
jgi:hypothetical protein